MFRHLYIYKSQDFNIWSNLTNSRKKLKGFEMTFVLQFDFYFRDVDFFSVCSLNHKLLLTLKKND